MMTPTAFEAGWREAQRKARAGEAPPKPPEGAFHFEAERLLNVIRALEAGDISDCKANDVKHAIEAMTHVFMLADLVPEFLDGFMHIATRHYAAMHHKAIIGEMAQKRADAEGFGEEWRAAIEAGNTPNQKDYMARMVAVIMKANGLNQEQAIAEIARQSGRGDDAIPNIRRVVTRSKKRKAK
jgi:hypothetical protein